MDWKACLSCMALRMAVRGDAGEVGLCDATDGERGGVRIPPALFCAMTASMRPIDAA
jgi:hypothetical protein